MLLSVPLWLERAARGDVGLRVAALLVYALQRRKRNGAPAQGDEAGREGNKDCSPPTSLSPSLPLSVQFIDLQ